MHMLGEPIQRPRLKEGVRTMPYQIEGINKEAQIILKNI